MYLPLYVANQIKKSFAVEHASTEHSNHFTILDLSYGIHGSKALRVPDLYRLVA